METLNSLIIKTGCGPADSRQAEVVYCVVYSTMHSIAQAALTFPGGLAGIYKKGCLPVDSITVVYHGSYQADRT